MRPHPALRSLSSDHHVGLVIARRARKAANEGARAQKAAWEVVKSRFFTEVEGHFRHEEQGLLPMLRTAGEVTLVQRTLSEHRTLRTLIAEDRPENLSVFAELLAAHVRFEESELFETAQRLLGLDALAQLEQVPTDARQTVHGPAEPKGAISSRGCRGSMHSLSAGKRIRYGSNRADPDFVDAPI